jgi:hypothetical protein
LPRRYRPPTRRRRPKKQTLPGQPGPPDQAPEDAGQPDELAAADAFEEAETLAYEDEEDDELEPEQVPVFRRHGTAHVAVRDHSHVLADLQRIAIIVGFIMAGIIITAVLR